VSDPSSIAVVVPEPLDQRQLAGIDPGSGIVAIPASDWAMRAQLDAPTPADTPEHAAASFARADRLVLDYEGGRSGSESFRTFADRVHHAHGRQTTRYPTVARITVSADTVALIGFYDPLEGEIDLVDDLAYRRLAAWLGRRPTDATAAALAKELHTTCSAKHQQRREIRAALASGTPNRAAIASYARRYGHTDLL